ncbi:MAG: response regulator [Deltaproteobacteria bacterium]|nr:response regulator [Deltaproteobacteria bacterium]MBW2597370.1 response regulator [Deltaproteobacteria bacterium]MBW2639597.1 response regulator [Deltaproteobacteria bacterium]MBW2680138.1 response regulator [Deltaproteobacteria bacterium]
MIRLLLVTPHRNSLLELALAMEKYDDVELTWTDSGQKALDKLSETSVDLVVIDKDLGDMPGLEFAEKLLRVNPMINSAVLSSLPSHEFHEASEGLGVFAQLPLRPAKKDAEKLLKGLRNLKDLTAGITIGSKDPGS